MFTPGSGNKFYLLLWGAIIEGRRLFEIRIGATIRIHTVYIYIYIYIYNIDQWFSNGGASYDSGGCEKRVQVLFIVKVQR